MADNFNGSTITLAGTAIGKVVSINHTESAAEIDVTSVDDSAHVFEAGIPSHGVSVEVTGTASAVDVGDTGALVVTWTDAQATTLGNAVCTSKRRGGSLDNKITTSLEFKQAPSA